MSVTWLTNKPAMFGKSCINEHYNIARYLVLKILQLARILTFMKVRSPSIMFYSFRKVLSIHAFST